ncbi:hypothetical protein ACTI_54600 [Actinoplanes sp. OR16]|uniref:hypothetical protein n=1 Tax=Actinoplanes sp. OR16 TaxID=946334 RepID=UPI000F7013D5|nr:hypothetical protein [Actinoplanes sp. OR16]BBH68775.1 hypothetical protein ACTI_54600 [Actinoplanes sp. OR16]
MNEQLITDAYEAIAATAVSPERVRARIDARTRVHRRRRLLLAGAGLATVVAAVGLPLALYDRRGDLPAAPALEAPLFYAPGWLPGGVTERYRSVTFDTRTGEGLGATRRWYPKGSPYSVVVPPGSVGITVGERLEPEVSEPVTVGSARGIRWVASDTAHVQWQPAGGPVILVSAYGTADDEDTALRMARSVTPTAESVAVTLSAPEIPARFEGTAVYEVYPAGFLSYDDGWQAAGYQALTVDSGTARNVGFALSTTPPESGTPFQAVERDDIMIYLTGEVLTAAEALRILERVECESPDLSWAS